MGIFDRKPSIETMDEKLDNMTISNQVLEKKKEEAELQAAIKELQSKYGSGWKRILGVGSHFSLQDLKVFLTGAKKGLQKQSIQGKPVGQGGPMPITPGSDRLSVLPPSGVRRA